MIDTERCGSSQEQGALRVNRRVGESVKDVMQVLAVLCVIALVSMILHKAYADVSALSQNYAGGEFWIRLARYLIANLAGG